MDVDGVAAWHATFAGDVLDKAVIIVTHNQGVMQELLELLVGAQVHHVCRHGGAQRAEAPWEGIRGVGEEGVARRHIAVVDHEVSVVYHAISSSYASRTPVAVQDLVHLTVGVNRAAHFGDDLAERLDDAVHATLGVPDPIGDLQIGERRIDCGNARRVTTDEERVETERLLHMGLLEELADPPFKEADRIKTRHGREELDEVLQVQEILAARDENPFAMDRTRRGEEGLELIGVVVRELAHLGEQLLTIATKVKVPIFARPEDAIARLQLAQRDVVRHLLAGCGVDLFKEPGHGDERWAGVEGVAALLNARGAAANLGAGLQDGDLPAVGEEADGRGEAAEAAPHDDRRSTPLRHGPPSTRRGGSAPCGYYRRGAARGALSTNRPSH